MFGSSSIYQGHKNTRSLKVCNNQIMELHPNAGRIEIETFKQVRKYQKTVGYYLVGVPAKIEGLLWLRWPCKGQVRSQCYNGFADEVSSLDCRCKARDILTKWPNHHQLCGIRATSLSSKNSKSMAACDTDRSNIKNLKRPQHLIFEFQITGSFSMIGETMKCTSMFYTITDERHV